MNNRTYKIAIISTVILALANSILAFVDKQYFTLIFNIPVVLLSSYTLKQISKRK